MKKYLFSLILAFGSALILSAQPIAPRSIEDSVIGWKKVYHLKGAKEPLKFTDKTYSIAQLSICDSLLNWMQASYLPKGGLGDATKTVVGNLSVHNQKEASLPQSYGAYTKTYTELRYNSSGKMEPVTDSHERWSIMANAPVGIPADVFCTATQYYFTLPSFEEQGYGEDLPLLYGLATHANTKKYFTYFRRNSRIGNEKTVLLCKDNKLPFIKITKGEYLQAVEAAIAKTYETEKKQISDQNKNDQRAIDYAMKYLDEKNAKRLICLRNNKDKYGDRLQEPAQIFTDQPDVHLENYPDVFEGTGGSAIKLFVYKIDPVMAALCKKDTPQWLVITWHGDVTNPIGKHQHESIINNFNFEYVYNFFLDPAKVNGQPYKPLRSPLFEEAVVVTGGSAASKKIASDKGIHFFEDFSTNGTGQRPIGWDARSNREGVSSIVTIIDDTQAKWAIIDGNSIAPKDLKKPLPQNFTLSFDVVVPENFTWGAKGLVIIISKEKTQGVNEAFIRLKVRPGSGTGSGEAELETKFPPTYANGSKWYVIPNFSNNKKLNPINVTIRKNGEVLQLIIDKNVIAEYGKGVPADMSFNALSFTMGQKGGENDHYYVSNIKITKD
jgi:hypothetical protein